MPCRKHHLTALLGGLELRAGYRLGGSQARLSVTDWMCVTETGVVESHRFKVVPEGIDLVARHTKELPARPARK